MRSKQAVKNVLSNIFLQITLAVCGLILPRLYLITYGSEMNGVVSSLTQFMTYLTLVESGIGAAAVVSLYGPLADKNESEISGVLVTTQKFYIKSGIFYVFLVGALVYLYPLVINDVISDSTIRYLAIIFSASNLVDYFFLGKYNALLTADQKVYVIVSVQIFGTILNTLIAACLMICHCNIIIVKGVSTIVYMLRSILIYAYVKKKYPYVNLKAEPKVGVFSERWSALIHQIAGLVLNNTNLILLTFFGGQDALLIISVYTVYQMVANIVSNLIGSFTKSLSAGFGELFYKKDYDKLKNAYSEYEYIFFMLLFILYTCMLTLFVSFIKLYTADVTDYNYIRISYAILFVLIGIFTNLRSPGITLIIAVGHYKKTQFRAVCEAIINIVIGLLLVHQFQGEGMLLGTLCAFIYSCISVLRYCEKYLLPGMWKKTLSRILRNSVLMFFLYLIFSRLSLDEATTYLRWIVNGVVVMLFTTIIFTIVNLGVEPEQMKKVGYRVKNILQI